MINEKLRTGFWAGNDETGAVKITWGEPPPIRSVALVVLGVCEIEIDLPTPSARLIEKPKIIT
jgi:hypothetical protein